LRRALCSRIFQNSEPGAKAITYECHSYRPGAASRGARQIPWMSVFSVGKTRAHRGVARCPTDDDGRDENLLVLALDSLAILNISSSTSKRRSIMDPASTLTRTLLISARCDARPSSPDFDGHFGDRLVEKLQHAWPHIRSKSQHETQKRQIEGLLGAIAVYPDTLW